MSELVTDERARATSALCSAAYEGAEQNRRIALSNDLSDMDVLAIFLCQRERQDRVTTKSVVLNVETPPL